MRHPATHGDDKFFTTDVLIELAAATSQRNLFTMGNTNMNATTGSKINIAIFASGSGSNAQKIIEYFIDHEFINVALVACNVPSAGVISRAENFKVPVLLIDKARFLNGSSYLPQLLQANIHFIVLAGFLLKIPEELINHYRGKIVNIHPALLPKFGGKGMYGSRVHQAVINAGEQQSGITIHNVDEHYDNGDSILQVTCPVLPNDTPEALAQRIHLLEHEYYPKTIEKLIMQVFAN